MKLLSLILIITLSQYFPLQSQSLGKRLSFTFETEAELAVDLDLMDVSEWLTDDLINARNNQKLPPIGRKYRSHLFLNSVGGVSFDQTAIPINGLAINSMEIHYQNKQADGSRLDLTINDKPLNVNISDWMLIPIAKYADSPYKSCVTMFGSLTDKKLEERLKSEGATYFLNYHKAFKNTLLGMRLAQLDMFLVFWENDLYKVKGEYVLGLGEKEPDLKLNMQGIANLNSKFNELMEHPGNKYSAYVICDYNQFIEFDIQDQKLTLKGEPFYYFWRRKYENVNENIEQYTKNVLNEIDAFVKEKSEEISGFNKNRWIVSVYRKTLDTYKNGEFTFYPLNEFNSLYEDIFSSDEFSKESFPYIAKNIAFFESNMKFLEIEYLEELSQKLSSQSEMFAVAIPEVWTAAQNTIRFAGFFRYCKEKFPNEWQSFLQEMDGNEPLPYLKTPTVIWRK